MTREVGKPLSSSPVTEPPRRLNQLGLTYCVPGSNNNATALTVEFYISPLASLFRKLPTRIISLRCFQGTVCQPDELRHEPLDKFDIYYLSDAGSPRAHVFEEPWNQYQQLRRTFRVWMQRILQEVAENRQTGRHGVEEEDPRDKGCGVSKLSLTVWPLLRMGV